MSDPAPEPPARDPDHWLHRHDAAEWLSAATHELALVLEASQSRQHKKSVVLGRRAAGMALNAVLTRFPDESWGRSYVEHLQAAANDAAVDKVVREACAQLLELPLEAPRFVRIGGGGDQGIAAAAATVIDWARFRLDPEPA